MRRIKFWKIAKIDFSLIMIPSLVQSMPVLQQVGKREASLDGLQEF